MEVFRTIGDTQKNVEFGIYQGEARHVSGNVKLGAFGNAPLSGVRA